MLSQMNLRFTISLIAALKNRAAAEAVPANTLAERLLQQTLATSVAGDKYRALCAAPYTTLGQLYRKIVRAETVDGQALSRAAADHRCAAGDGGGLDVDPHYN
ncbi:TPA: hypothetical protein ON323_003356 [Serratia marcescens]|nr:hypothetical protein [Serratia marcescens]